MLKLLKSTKAQLLIITLFTVLAYSNIFQNNFAADDIDFIFHWDRLKTLDNLNNVFTTQLTPPEHTGVYRPLKILYLTTLYQLFGANPFGYHLHGVLVHLVSTILVYFIARQLTSKVKKMELHLRGGEYLPFTSSLLFGLHPVHTEAVTSIIASLDTTGILFFFLSFYLYLQAKNTSKVKKMELHLRGWLYAGSVLSALIAFFTYEMTLTLPLLLFGYELIVQSTKFKVQNYSSKFKIFNFKPILLTLIPYFLSACLYLFIRFIILQIPGRGEYLNGSFITTMLVMSQVFVKYLTLLFVPVGLSINHQLNQSLYALSFKEFLNPEVFKNYSLLNPQILFNLGLLSGLAFLGFKSLTCKGLQRRPILTFSIGWFFISLLPVSLILPQGEIMAERYLYLASFGFCLLLGYLFAKIFNSKFSIFNEFLILKALKYLNFNSNFKLKIKNYILVTGLLLLITFYFYQTYQRNKDWKNTLTIWIAQARIYPEDIVANFNIADLYAQTNQDQQALFYFQKTLNLHPNFPQVYFRIGQIYQKHGLIYEAKLSYKKALELNPNYVEAKAVLENIP